MKVVRKNPLTLLEVGIALFIASILITFLLRTYSQIQILDHKIDKTRQEIVQRQHFQKRLHQVFSQIPSASVFVPKEPSLYTEQFPQESTLSLVCFFDNGIDLDPSFSGPILGRLTVIENDLCLLMWPFKKNHSKTHYRKEILLHDIFSIDYEFLGPTDPKYTHARAKKINEDLEWNPHWHKKRKELPSVIRIHLNQKNDLSFAFLLPKEESITYTSSP